MRNYINLFEDARPATQLLTIATTLAHFPFDIDFNLSLGNVLKTDLKKAKQRFEADMMDEESTYEFDARDYVPEFLPSIYGQIVSDLLLVKREVKAETMAYQSRKGQEMDDEAGHADDMHFVEASDWLTAMQAQDDAARQLSVITASTMQDIGEITNVLDSFIEKWKEYYRTDQGEEAVLTESMRSSLAEIIPLMMYAAKVLG